MILKAILTLIRFYQQAVSPYLGRWCRFAPSCSEYAYQAVVRYGVLRGGVLGVRRICRCHPFCVGGYDPVPDDPMPSETCSLRSTPAEGKGI